MEEEARHAQPLLLPQRQHLAPLLDRAPPALAVHQVLQAHHAHERAQRGVQRRRRVAARLGGGGVALRGLSC